MASFVLVAVEVDGLNGATGNLLFRQESSHAMPRIGESYEIESTMHKVHVVDHRRKRSAAPKHCQVIIHVDKIEFAQLKRDNSWRDSVYEAFQHGIVE